MKQKGFTLIELLVVIAIIGILSTVVLASINQARLKSRDGRRISDIKQLSNALTLFYDDDATKAYPTNLSALIPTRIAVMPLDPSTGGEYLYAALGTTECSNYHLGATLESASNTVLGNDADLPVGVECTGSAVDFDGADPVYDVTP